MTVKTLSELCGFSAAALPSPEREIDGCYVGDLLSWVMGRANANNAWITIMSNVNVVAVATLTEPAAVILAESVELQSDALASAKENGITVLSTSLSAYEIAVRLDKAVTGQVQ